MPVRRGPESSETGSPRPARLWKAHHPQQTHQTRTVIAKLRASSEPVRRVARALRAHRIADVTGTPLARLVDNGYAVGVEPVFDVVFPVDTVRRGLRYLAAAAAPAAGETGSVKHSRGLVEITVDRAADARDLAAHVQSMPEVEYAYVPAIRHMFAKRSRKGRPDPLASRQWAHGAVRIAHARRKRTFKDGSTVTVAIADSGIDVEHPDLKHAVSEYRNFVEGERDRDYAGHGTHVAGIISAGFDNGVGISGLCAARILALKVLPRRDSDWSAKAYYRGLRHALGRAQVLNLSLGGEEDRGELEVLRDLIDGGVVVVAAMGNEFEEGNPVEYPAAMDDVFAVGATDQLDRRASFSNTGAHIDIAAPGVEILSTTPTYAYDDGRSDYDSWDGTSMAAPHVSAAVALLLARSPRLTPAQAIKRVKARADRVTGMSSRSDPSFGAGRLNIEAALR